jgi:hypothetical protein
MSRIATRLAKAVLCESDCVRAKVTKTGAPTRSAAGIKEVSKGSAEADASHQ